MKAGLLRHRITIQRRTDALDAYGEAQPTWAALVSNYPARVRDDSQREFAAAMQVQAQKSIHIEIRDPRIEITTKDRVIFDARTFDIQAVLGGENVGRDLVLICSEHSTE